ncbi:MAG: hypothetical protein OHK0029_26060 [Armatimonadaceae bacterium]
MLMDTQDNATDTKGNASSNNPERLKGNGNGAFPMSNGGKSNGAHGTEIEPDTDTVPVLDFVAPETLPKPTAPEELPERPDRKGRLPIRIEQTPQSFTHLHTAIEYGAAATTIRAEELEDASLFQSGRPVVLGVTSAIAGEGKTTVALHLAMDIARNNFKKVCLMDMALGEDTLSQRLGVNTGLGLVNVLEGSHNTIPTLESDEIEGLCVMPAGKTPSNPARAARSPSVAEVIAASRELFDVIIVDLPAVATGNTLPIVPHLDAMIMVVCSGVTPRKVVESALDRLGKKKILGVVLNRVKSPTPTWMQRRLGQW